MDNFRTFPSIHSTAHSDDHDNPFHRQYIFCFCHMTTVPVTLSIISEIDFNFNHPHVGRRGHYRSLNVGFAWHDGYRDGTVELLMELPGMIIIVELCSILLGSIA